MIKSDSSLNGTPTPQPPAPKQTQDEAGKARFIYSRLNWKDQGTIRRYFMTRKLVIDPQLSKEIGFRVSRFNDELAVVVPLRTPEGEICQLQKIVLDSQYRKVEKRFLNSYSGGDRGLLIRRSPERLTICEGVEDALTILLKVRSDTSVLCSFGTAGFSRLQGFIDQFSSIVAILDPDEQGQSLKAASRLPDTVKRLMPAMTGIDANSAHQAGELGAWIKSLRQP